MDNFDLKKYLVENKVTTNSRMMNEADMEATSEAISTYVQLMKRKFGKNLGKVIEDNLYDEANMAYDLPAVWTDEEFAKFAKQDLELLADMDGVDVIDANFAKQVVAQALEAISGIRENKPKMVKEDQDFSVELLVPKIYFNVETGELAKTPAAFGGRSELKNMDITNYSDGEELIEWVFDGSLEKAKYFEKEYPGLFKIVTGTPTMNEAEDFLIPNIKETAALLKQEGIPFKMASEREMENELGHGVDLSGGGDSLEIIKLKDRKGNNIYVSEFGYGAIGVDGANIFDDYPEFWENRREDWATDSPKEMVAVLKKYFL
jgi:hypothetical protein